MNAGVTGLLCALTGPVLLMTLGGLLTAHRFTDVTFGKTWPILLIVLGLMKLAQRLTRVASTPGTEGAQ